MKPTKHHTSSFLMSNTHGRGDGGRKPNVVNHSVLTRSRDIGRGCHTASTELRLNVHTDD